VYPDRQLGEENRIASPDFEVRPITLMSATLRRFSFNVDCVRLALLGVHLVSNETFCPSLSVFNPERSTSEI